MSSALFYFYFFRSVFFSRLCCFSFLITLVCVWLSAAIWDDREKCFFQVFSMCLGDKMENHTLSAHKNKTFCICTERWFEIALITFFSPQTRSRLTRAQNQFIHTYLSLTNSNTHTHTNSHAYIQPRTFQARTNWATKREREKKRARANERALANNVPNKRENFYQIIFSHSIQQIKVKL